MPRSAARLRFRHRRRTPWQTIEVLEHRTMLSAVGGAAFGPADFHDHAVLEFGRGRLIVLDVRDSISYLHASPQNPASLYVHPDDRVFLYNNPAFPERGDIRDRFDFVNRLSLDLSRAEEEQLATLVDTRPRREVPFIPPAEPYRPALLDYSDLDIQRNAQRPLWGDRPVNGDGENGGGEQENPNRNGPQNANRDLPPQDDRDPRLIAPAEPRAPVRDHDPTVPRQEPPPAGDNDAPHLHDSNMPANGEEAAAADAELDVVVLADLDRYWIEVARLLRGDSGPTDSPTTAAELFDGHEFGSDPAEECLIVLSDTWEQIGIDPVTEFAEPAVPLPMSTPSVPAAKSEVDSGRAREPVPATP